jgi:hypothetical protein
MRRWVATNNIFLTFDIYPQRKFVRAFQMAREGKGSKETAKALNAEGFRTRDGKLFGTTIINYWLRNPVYTGVIAWNRTDRTRDKVLHKPPSEIVCTSDTHQPIVIRK